MAVAATIIIHMVYMWSSKWTVHTYWDSLLCMWRWPWQIASHNISVPRILTWLVSNLSLFEWSHSWLLLFLDGNCIWMDNCRSTRQNNHWNTNSKSLELVPFKRSHKLHRNPKQSKPASLQAHMKIEPRSFEAQTCKKFMRLHSGDHIFKLNHLK